MEDYLSEKEKWEWLREQIRDNALTVIGAVALRHLGIDTDTDKIVGTLPSSAGSEQLVDHPYGRFLHVANQDRNMVAVIDIEKCTSLRQVPVGEPPWDVFIAAP